MAVLQGLGCSWEGQGRKPGAWMLSLHENSLRPFPFPAVACLTLVERDARGPGSSSVMEQENSHLGLFSGCHWISHHELFFTRRRTGRKEGRVGGRRGGRHSHHVHFGSIWGLSSISCHLIFWGPPRLLTFTFILLFRMLVTCLRTCR